ncbi:MAG: ACT domain-containing protein [Clostridia bacterium]|nr:ACT domain-containing protein [Clostridia bacterium]
MQTKAGPSKLLLVDASVLPDVFEKVLEAKKLLASGDARSASEAARLAGLSRSAFYKYKDMVFAYDADGGGQILTIHFVLSDRPGVLSAVLTAYASAGANVLTVNQNIPADGVATVSVSAHTDRMEIPTEQFLKQLSELPGVRRISRIGAETASKKRTAAQNTE